MDKQWIKRLGQHTAETTERLYVRILEDAEVFIGLMAEGVEAWGEGIQQRGVAIGQLVAKTARTCTLGIGVRKGWGRLAWLWRPPGQLQ